MKATLIAVALLALPVAATATAAMEPQQATQSLRESRPAHHPLFTVKFVLRQPPPEKAPPEIIIDQASPQIVPPMSGGVPAIMLGALHLDPNMIVCYGWGCEYRGL
ncbi:MAG: hypothetical protein HOQ10_11910 [Frateuria sp.]|uniref:hypothetical protein n=1 Tax=Frateuria sp. TaxID=2211372 RepID=UPI0017CDEC1F|nr:hypothetical protein [Frateuria sp.]NUO73405.1 hypothetical protein [Frateuria sp.]NUR23854.1 hypothetical protein [Frateuria sp.]